MRLKVTKQITAKNKEKSREIIILSENVYLLKVTQTTWFQDDNMIVFCFV